MGWRSAGVAVGHLSRDMRLREIARPRLTPGHGQEEIEESEDKAGSSQPLGSWEYDAELRRDRAVPLTSLYAGRSVWEVYANDLIVVEV